jgi:hypothetical protein
MPSEETPRKIFKTLSKEQMPVEEIQTKLIDDSFMIFVKHLWDILDKTLLEAFVNTKSKNLEESIQDSNNFFDGSAEPQIRLAWHRFLQHDWIQKIHEHHQINIFLLVCARILANILSVHIRQTILYRLDPLSPPRLTRQTAISNLNCSTKQTEELESCVCPKILPAFRIEPFNLDDATDTPLMNAWKRIWFNYENCLTHIYNDMIHFMERTKTYINENEEKFPGSVHEALSLLISDHLDTEVERANLLRATDAAAGWLKNAPCCLPAGILHCSENL